MRVVDNYNTNLYPTYTGTVDVNNVGRYYVVYNARDLSGVNQSGDRVIAAGAYRISVGGGQPGTDAPRAETEFSINGEQRLPD